MRISDWSSDVCSSDLGTLERSIVIGVGRAGVRENFAQAAAWQIRRTARHVDHALTAGHGDAASAPRPEPGQGAEQPRLVGALRSFDLDVLAGLDDPSRRFEAIVPGRRADLEAVEIGRAHV